MLGKFSLLAFAGLFFCNSCALANDGDGDADWMLIAGSSDGVAYDVKKYSIGVVNLDKSGRAVQGIFKYIDPNKPHDITLEKIFVNIKDCKNGEGKIYYADMTGTAFDNNYFVTYGTSLASTLGSFLCSELDIINGIKREPVDANSMWVSLATTDDGNDVYFYKKYTGDIVRGKSGQYATLTIAHGDKRQSKLVYQKISVSKADCAAGAGRIEFSNLDFSNPDYENFVFDGGNIASALAKNECSLFDEKQ